MSDQQVFDQVREHKHRLGQQLVILAHHYQADEACDLAGSTEYIIAAVNESPAGSS